MTSASTLFVLSSSVLLWVASASPSTPMDAELHCAEEDSERADVEVLFLQTSLDQASLKQGKQEPDAIHPYNNLQLDLSSGVQSFHESSQSFRSVLTNSYDMTYFTQITLGSQVMNALVDTGSFELLVFSQYCERCGNSNGLYNYSLSETYTMGSTITRQSFGSGDTYTMEGYDALSLGPFATSKTAFWEVYDADMPVLANADFQAIIGVGPPRTPKEEALESAQVEQNQVDWFRNHTNRVPTMVQRQAESSLELAHNAVQKQTVLEAFGTPTFSVCLGRTPLSHGYFTWGDRAMHENTAAFHMVPLHGTTTWSAGLASVHLAPEHGGGGGAPDMYFGCEGHRHGCSAVIDSGTSLLVLPQHAANRLQEALEVLDPDCSNLDSLPHLHFDLGGVRHSLPPDAYVGEVVGDVPELAQGFFARHRVAAPSKARTCELLIMVDDLASDHGPVWILGMPFFREYYTVFDTGLGGEHRQPSLYTARADDDCRPAAAGDHLSLVEGNRSNHGVGLDDSKRSSKRPMRRLQASKLQAPRWRRLAKRSEEGHGHIKL